MSRLGLQRMTLESGIPSDGDGQMRLGLQRMTLAKLIFSHARPELVGIRMTKMWITYG
jgi:hypothetical protein